ncbi:hypothetical protein I7V34_14695 [Bacillus sp. V3]|nr:hypothetical protein I7V34_14695 [Bacillus sp. V3]
MEYLGGLGVFVTIQGYLEDRFKGHWITEIFTLQVVTFILVIFLIGNLLRIINTHRTEKKRYSREFLKKSSIGYEVGSFWDVVKRYEKEEELAIILGVNNRFNLDGSYLNNRSLVYDFVCQMGKEKVNDLHNDIAETFNAKRVSVDESGSPVYEYGSIHVVGKMEGIHYETGLLAMCEPSKSKISQRFQSERKILSQAFEKMFEEMPGIFTNSIIIIPLIGTSSSGSPLSHEEVAKYLISAFADYSRIQDGRLAKRFIISIYHQDIKNNYIHLEDIKRHIDNECDSREFSYSKIKFQLESGA